MEAWGSLLCLKNLSTGHCPAPDESNPYLLTPQFSKKILNFFLTLPLSSSLKVSPPKFSTYISCLSCLLNVRSISPSLGGDVNLIAPHCHNFLHPPATSLQQNVPFSTASPDALSLSSIPVSITGRALEPHKRAWYFVAFYSLISKFLERRWAFGKILRWTVLSIA